MRYAVDDSYMARAEALKSLGKSGTDKERPLLEEALTIRSPRNVIHDAARWGLDTLSR